MYVLRIMMIRGGEGREIIMIFSLPFLRGASRKTRKVCLCLLISSVLSGLTPGDEKKGREDERKSDGGGNPINTERLKIDR